MTTGVIQFGDDLSKSRMFEVFADVSPAHPTSLDAVPPATEQPCIGSTSATAPGNAAPGTGDGFGLLPIEVRAAGWRRWLDSRCVRIHADHIELINGTAVTSCGFASVAEVGTDHGDTRLIRRGDDANGPFVVPRGFLQAAHLDLVRRLIAEEQRLEALRRLPPPRDRDALAVVREALTWRGRPYVHGVEFLLDAPGADGASDLHLEPGPDSIRVSWRRERELIEAGVYARTAHAGIVARLKHLAGCHSHLTGTPQEGAFSRTGAGSEAVEVRLSVFPSLHGERVSLRFIRPIRHGRLIDLGWPDEAVAAWRTLLAEGPGLLLLTGPVGSGKTTALYATLAELAHPADHSPRRVTTLEDPVEARVGGICQSSLDPRAGLTLAEAFKHMLRQDPDVMALGEIRDAETLREALQAGLAGHLVLATFHAADPAGALARCEQLGVDHHLLTTSLRGIAGLRLASGTAGPRRLVPQVMVTALMPPEAGKTRLEVLAGGREGAPR